MQPASSDIRHTEGQAIRHADAAALARALQASRRDTLATFTLHEAAGRLRAQPDDPDHNPPLWELGHVGWFQELWTVRNPERGRGAAADPAAQYAQPLRPGADALYDSSRVPHAARATLPLPDAGATRADLAAQLEACLQGLRKATPDDAGLYFYRLALLHEDMHHEASLWLAQAQGLAIGDPRWQPLPLTGGREPLHVEADTRRLGSAPGGGFAFDNELQAHAAAVGAFDIDRRAVSWDEFLPFVEAGGYRDARWWQGEGERWWHAARPEGPRHLRRDGGAWRQWRWG